MYDQLSRCEEMGVRAMMMNMTGTDVSADDRQGSLLLRVQLVHLQTLSSVNEVSSVICQSFSCC